MWLTFGNILLHVPIAFFSNYQRGPMPRVIVAPHSGLRFILREEWSQRSWVIVPVNCNRNVWKTNSYTCSSPHILATMLITLNNGQKNSVSVCRHLSLSDRIRISYCTSGIDFLNLNNLGRSLSFQQENVQLTSYSLKTEWRVRLCSRTIHIWSFTDPMPLGVWKEF